MSEKISMKDMRMNRKAVTIRIIILLAMILAAGIATRLITQGAFDRVTTEGHTVIVEDSFHYLESDPQPIWRWFIAPLKALASSSTTIMIMLMLLFMGGIMVVLDKSKVIMYLVSYIIKKFGSRKYMLLYVLSGVMMLLLLLGGTILSALVSGRVKMKDIFTGFLQGIRITAPAVLVLFLIVGTRQIIVDGQIMDMLLYYCYRMIEGTSPYIAIFIILAITMLMEFVVSGASAKAFLILPLLVPLGNLVGLTSQSVVQAYAYGDGFANAFYPTSTMLLIITGIANFTFTQWYRFTGRLIFRIILFVIVTLLICVGIHYGPF